MRPMMGLAAIVVGTLSSVVMAGTYSFTPTPKDLGDMDHTRAITWGINTPWSAKEVPVSAVLTFDNIRNWAVEPNKLYVNLLDYAKLGVTGKTDNQASGDYFAGQGTPLITYVNLPTTKQDLSYSFTSAQLAMLGTYAADGRFGLSFDPDCHYYNDGVKLCVTTAAIPLPAASMMAIPAAAVAGWAGWRRRRWA